MSTPSYFEMIAPCVAEVTGCPKFKGGDRLKEDLGLDSLSLVTLIVELEQKFAIVFDDGDLDPERLVSVDDVAGLVEKYV